MQCLGFRDKTISVDLNSEHCNMYRNTRFGELLKVLDQNEFQRCVDRYQSDKHTKGFNSWDHLVSMMYAQLSGARSLRELEVGYNSQAPHHYHLNCGPIKRSTLSDANSKRDASVFESFCQVLMSKAHSKVRRELKDLLYLIDSTPICLRGRGYDWTERQSMSRVPGMKLHVLFAPDQQLPCHSRMTASNVNDVEYGREELVIEPGAKYVFDKGYCDYNWWYKMDQAGAGFVTRLKRNAALKVVERKQTQGVILSDEVVQFSNKNPGGGRKNHYLKPLRRIRVEREEHEALVLVTNQMDESAESIAAQYKKRWAIELWFKWIKQNLKIKKFLGRSENAVRIQVLVALITYLVAYLYRQLSGAKKDFYLWMVELKVTLFQRVELDHAVHRRRREQMKRLREIQPSLI